MAPLRRHRARHRSGRAASRRRVSQPRDRAPSSRADLCWRRSKLSMKLRNKVALVTGGARGIGLAIARRYVAEGAKVVIADKDREAGPACAVALGHADCRFVATEVG